MSLKDALLALCVVVLWGVNFVVIKVGLNDMPPFLLAGLRFSLVVLPAIFFVPFPRIPLKWLLAYGMTISFGQFGFLFLAIKLGMPAGIASLVLQAQAFFTLLVGAVLLSEKLRWNHVVGILVAALGMVVLAEGRTALQMSSGMTTTTLLLTLAAALVPVVPFFISSWLFEGRDAIVHSLTTIQLPTILSLIYLAFAATIIGYGIWGSLLARYETWRVAPLSLLVPVVGLVSAAVFLGESLSLLQIVGALLIMVGLLVNVFGARLRSWLPARPL